MINALLTGFLNLIISLISIILSPIDTAIITFLPDLTSAFAVFGSFLDLVSNGIGWVVNASCLSSEALSLIVLYYTFKLTAPMTFYLIKLALSWYNKIKP